ncbi:MAG: hypothetical protein J6S73_03945 [Lentisphaeria bacterium]|nr:hypothetical protein [Lentisphaeria bacterium]
MDFIKRHYEKLLLAGLLVMFIGSMVYLVMIMKDTGAVSADKLKIREKAPDVKWDQAETENSGKYDRQKNVFGMAPWSASKPRSGSKYQDFYSDLVVTFGAARCGHDKCARVIPMFYFGTEKAKGQCPWCKQELSAPPKQAVLRTGMVTAEDPDGCGIPHDVKRQYNLPENDPGNVLDDLDRDGFSNLYEYKQKTALNNPKSHPPLWHRLVVDKIERVKLPLQLRAVTVPDAADKSRWDVQINWLEKKPGGAPGEMQIRRTETSMLKERIRIEDVDYTVKDIVQDLSEKDKEGNPIDKSYIDVVSDKGVLIRMQIGKDVYSPDAKAHLKDLGNGKEYVLSEGQEIRIGNSKTKRARYIVKTINQQKKQVMLQENSGKNKGKMLPEPITRRGKIREYERIRPQSQNRSGAMDMMPDMM